MYLLVAAPAVTRFALLPLSKQTNSYLFHCHYSNNIYDKGMHNAYRIPCEAIWLVRQHGRGQTFHNFELIIAPFFLRIGQCQVKG